MKVLLTGASGYIGRTFTLRLLEEGHQLTLLGRSRPVYPEKFEKKVSFVKADISQADLFPANAAPISEQDVVVHLAASLDFLGDRSSLYKTNVLGTGHILELARKVKAKRLVFSSSIEAIGPRSSTVDFLSEEASPEWISSYGWSKCLAEKLLRRFPLPGCEKVIIRIGNVYGPGSPSFIQPVLQAIHTQNIFLQAIGVIGQSQFQPLFVDDVVEGLCQALLQRNPGGTFHLTGIEAMSLKDVFHLIAGAFEEEVRVPSTSEKILQFELFLRNFACWLLKRGDWLTYFSFGSVKPLHRLFSSKKIRKIWGFSPATAFVKGLAKTIQWLKQEGQLT